MKKAVFLDRDGTLNRLVYSHAGNEPEPPHHTGELELTEGAVDALRQFCSNAYLIFVVSNQPDAAKGKTSLKALKDVHSDFACRLLGNGIEVTEYYYCYHHPLGIVKELAVSCECRKPGTMFVETAISEFQIDRANSWFVGDRESDIICGKNSGLRTVHLTSGQEYSSGGFGEEFSAKDILEAARIILKENVGEPCRQ